MPDKTRRLDAIEAMRGMAALAVALFHFNSQLHLPVIKDIAAYGWLGVDVFFVISGFVIPYSLWGRDHSIRQFPAYMARRIVRLEPPYLVSIVLIIVLWEISARAPGFQGGAPSYTPTQILYHLFYAIPLTSEHWLSPVYWSLAYEFVFYIITGLAFRSLIERNAAWTMIVVCAIFAAKLALTGRPDYLILMFVPGILAMRYVCGIDNRWTFLAWTSVCCAVISWLSPPSGFAIVFAVAVIVLLRNAVVRPWLLWLGGISYSLYLTHTAIGGRVVNLGNRLGDSVPIELGVLAAAVLISLAFAAAFSWAVERPAVRAARSIALRRTAFN